MIPAYKYVLTSLSGTVLGEILNPRERALALSLNRIESASCRVPLNNPMGAAMGDSSEKLLKAYRDHGSGFGLPKFVGPVLTSEEDVDYTSQTVQINAVSPLWRLNKRLLGTTKEGIAFGTQATPMEIVAIGKAIVDMANTQEFTGIRTDGTFVASSPANMSWVGPYWLKPAAEALAELTASVNSFDFTLSYVEPIFQDPNWPTLCYMNFSPLIGVQRPNAVFEYGVGANNLTGYNRQVSREGMMTQGFTAYPSNEQEPRMKEDAAARALRGLYQDVVPDGGVNNDAVRDAILQEHLYYRAKPREVITLKVAMNSDVVALRDFAIGDYVKATARVAGSLRFDAMFRVWGITFNADENGNEKVELELVAP